MFRFLSQRAWLPAALIALASASNAQEPAGLDAWRARHEGPWRVWSSPASGRAEMLYGSSVAAAAEPVLDTQFEELARVRITDAFELFGIDERTLALERVQFLPLGWIGASDKVTVRFRQSLGAIPVEDGWVNVLFDASGRMLSIQSRALPRLSSISAVPSIEAARAAEIARVAFERAERVTATAIATPELVVASSGRLAWRVALEWTVPDTLPIGFVYFVDALDGALLGRERSVHELEVRGTVKARVTPGLAPDTGGNSPVATPMRYLTVTSSAGTATTDASGNFSYPGVNTPLAVTVTFDGTFNAVDNEAGPDYTLTQTLPPNQDNTITMNPSGSASVTAQANAFHHINLLRDWVRAINPTDLHADHVADANVNVNDTCNAFFNGGSTNYFIAQGNCVNTAYSSVILHENGHWLNQRYFTGNGDDGMGEGNADVWSMYCLDSPIIGQDFCGSGCYIRTGLNGVPFCGDWNPACYGEVHADGLPWMGAAWKIRERLNVSLGNSAGDLAANALFLGWMNAYNQGSIQSIIETQWVILDDNDGDLNNGSPHFVDVDNAFRAQSFPGLTLHPITVGSATILPDVTADRGPYGVEAFVHTHYAGQVITSVRLNWRVNGGSLNTVDMPRQGTSLYGASIPMVVAPSKVEYSVTAQDNQSHTYTWPEDGPTPMRMFRVGGVVPFYFENFESGTNGWTHASYGDTPNTSDDWQFGTPQGRSDTYLHGLIIVEWHDPSAAYSGTKAFGNDLGIASDGGYGDEEHVRLRSPVLNSAGMFGLKLRYRRWLTAWTGVTDRARVRVNGAIAWTNEQSPAIFDAGWTLREIDIAPWADNQSALQIEFELLTDATVQCGGWNIDDVEIVRTGPAVPIPCPTPSTFGPGKLNSTGVTATLAGSGTPSPSGGFQLQLYDAPAYQLSVVYSSSSPGAAPFLGGTLLIASPYSRDVAWTTSVLGDASANLLIPPAFVGTRRFYQAIFRDPSSPDGSGFGLSRALRIDFCP